MKPLFRFLLRCIVSLFVGLFMVFNTKWHLIVVAFSEPSFYEKWLLCTLLSIVVVEQVRFFNKRLERLQIRRRTVLVYRILLCYLLPLSYIVASVAIYSNSKGTSIVRNGFFEFDLSLILMLLYLLNIFSANLGMIQKRLKHYKDHQQ